MIASLERSLSSAGMQYVILEAEDMVSALHVLRQSNIGLVSTDGQYPNSNDEDINPTAGLELLHEIKKIKNKNFLCKQVVLYTGEASLVIQAEQMSLNEVHLEVLHKDRTSPKQWAEACVRLLKLL